LDPSAKRAPYHAPELAQQVSDLFLQGHADPAQRHGMTLAKAPSRSPI